MHGPLQQSVVNYSSVKHLADDATNTFFEQAPVPYCIIDELVSTEFLQRLNRETTQKNSNPPNDQQFPCTTNKELALVTSLRHFIWELHAGRFISLLDQLLGMEGLLPDPHLRDAGLFWITTEGLAFNMPTENKQYGLDRRLTLIINLDNHSGIDQTGHLLLIDENDPSNSVKIASTGGGAILLKSSTSTGVEFKPATNMAAPVAILAIHYYAQKQP